MASAYQFNGTFTNGSAVVTAALAAFVANAKVGDLVRGPDERLYFVSAVNSNTQITLSRNYVGTTTTAAAELSRTGSGWNSSVEANVRLARIEESLARGYTLQSDASLAIGAGSKVFTNVEPGLNILDNIRFEATSRANPANKMRGHCTYAGSTLTMTVPAGGFSGSGTFADWNLNIIGADGATGPTGGTFSTVTKGSIPVGDGANVTAEAIGTNGSVLVADSTQTRGVRWSNGQIPFPASQNASADANTLDDYEEGTFTPALSFTTPGDLAVTYSGQSGSYTKIGRVVVYEMLIVTSAFTFTTAASHLRVTGLPFPCGGAFRGSGAVVMEGYTRAGADMLVFETASGGGSFFFVMSGGSGISRSELTTAHVPSGSNKQLFASGCYTA